MLNGATCSHSYSAWRYLAFRRLLEDAQGPSRASLPFLHPKTLHEHRRRQQRSKRHYHASSAKCATGEQLSMGSEGQDTSASEPDGLRPRGRILRKIRSEDGTDVEQTIEKKPWKPTSQEGLRDLQSLVQSLKEMSAQFKQVDQEGAARGTDPSSQQPDDYLELPTSPLEKHMAEKKKWHPKRRPTPEEKERLAHNPWAAMLAGPLRLDAASKARSPVALFMDLGHITNPKDGVTYLMPDDLADLEAFDRRLKNGHRSAALKRQAPDDAGEKIHILPYKLLLEELTDAFLVWDNVNQVGRTKKGVVAKRLFPAKWQEKAQKLEAYRSASKDYWDIRAKQGETDDGLHKRPKQAYDSNTLQWQPEIVERVPDIMRQRVLLAFNHIAQMQNQPKDKQRKLLYGSEWLEGRSMPLTDKVLRSMGIPVEYWNDMGDIESAQAITGTGERQGDSHDPRPPIAVQPSEIPEESVETPYDQLNMQRESSTVNKSGLKEKSSQLDKDDPNVWLPGSFVLHIGPPSVCLANLPYVDFSSLPLSYLPGTVDPALEHSKYIPPMITVAEAHRLPVFNIPAMLGPRFDSILRKILRRHQQHIDIPDRRLRDLNHAIIIKSVSPGSHFLAQELWQLWRYLGGRDCLLGTSAWRSTAGLIGQALSEPDESPMPHERIRKSKTGYRGLSDTAWDHLNGLLGLKRDQ